MRFREQKKNLSLQGGMAYDDAMGRGATAEQALARGQAVDQQRAAQEVAAFRGDSGFNLGAGEMSDGLFAGALNNPDRSAGSVFAGGDYMVADSGEIMSDAGGTGGVSYEVGADGTLTINIGGGPGNEDSGVLSTIGKYAVGGVETLAGGLYNYGVRLAGGLASIPYLADSVDTAAGVQEAFGDRYGYNLRSQGAQDIGLALQPVGEYLQGNIMNPLRSGSESLIGNGATTALFATAQAGLEIAGIVTGGRAVQSFLDDSLFVMRPMGGQLNGFAVPLPGGGLTRITTVTDQMRESFRGMGYLDPLTNTFKAAPLNEAIAVDHIYPTARIARLDGFNTLTKGQMTDIIQDRIGLGNLQPLPQSLNASKGSLLDFSFYGKQPLNSTYAANLAELQNAMQIKIQNQIRVYQQANRVRGQ